MNTHTHKKTILRVHAERKERGEKGTEDDHPFELVRVGEEVGIGADVQAVLFGTGFEDSHHAHCRHKVLLVSRGFLLFNSLPLQQNREAAHG